MTLLSRLRVKLWFLTVNKYRLWQLKKKLVKVKQTLKPELALWADNLEARLQDRTPAQAISILQKEISLVTEKQVKGVTELLDRALNK